MNEIETRTFYSVEPLRTWIRKRMERGAKKTVIAELLGIDDRRMQRMLRRGFLTLMEVARISRGVGVSIEDWPKHGTE